MEFYPAAARVPDGLWTDEFVLRPLRATDNALDYEAVMATQDTLRLRNAGEWPRPGFTPEENRADLEQHEADFAERQGFTYTMVNPAGTRCLGCVYFYPLIAALDRRGVDAAAAGVEGDEALAWFWVRPEGVAAELDRRLLAALLPWARHDFAFKRVEFGSWAADVRQVTILQEAGLRLVRSYPAHDTAALHFA